MKQKLEAINHIFSDHHGIYIPQVFVQNYDMNMFQGIDKNDINILLEGPDHEEYWDAWDNILTNAFYEEDGNTFRLYQDGDLWLWLINYDLMTDEEHYNMFGEHKE